MKQLFTILCGCLFFTFSVNAQLEISEYSASNLNQYPDNYAKFEDWIEIHNTSSSTLDLSGYSISDKESKPQKWMIPNGVAISGNSYITVWCSGRDEANDVNNMHTNFKLSQTKGNDFVVISDPDGNIIESSPLSITLMAHSMAKDENGDWKVSTAPTPGQSNNSNLYDGYTSEPVMNLDAGFYEGSVTVNAISFDNDVTLRYTTDGIEPNNTSPEWTPDLVLDQTRVIKVRAFSSNPAVLPGKMAFATYFIDESFTLPVYSVAAEQVQDLANGEKELRPIGSVEYFGFDHVITTSAYGELNSHGQDSWQNPHRSIDYICRDEMGYNNVLDAPLFRYSDRAEHQRLMFRASGDDNYPATDADYHEGSAHVRDEYVHTLALEGNMKLDVRAVERCILFLNGDYWGVYGMRERPVDHDYTKEYYDQGKYDLQYLATWGGSWAEYGGQQAFNDWGEIRDFILTEDMSDPANYQVAKDNIQLVSLIDYMIANLNSVASDWLNYNTGWWRGTNPDGSHKKWGYILWDNDATFDYYINYSGVPNTDPDAVPCDIDDISNYMDDFFGWGGGPNGDPGKHEKIFLKLQEESPIFRQLYYSRQADLQNTVYTCDNMLETLDRMIGDIEPEMQRQIDRWGGTYQEWSGNVAKMRGFIEQRCTLLDDGMVDCFEVTGPFALTIDVQPAGAGEIKLNTLDIEEFPWTGNYYGGMENLVEAKSLDDDLVFSHWETGSGSVLSPNENAREAAITLEGIETLTAVFEEISSIDDFSNEISFTAFPSPASDFVNVSYNLEQHAKVQLSLVSSIGEILYVNNSTEVKFGGQTYVEEINLDAAGVVPGVYYVKLNTGSNVATKKVIVVE